MTRTALIVSVVVLFCVSLIAVVLITLPTSESRKRFESLSRVTKEQRDLVATHKQMRQGVRKDLYISRPHHRLQALLTCPVSELTLTHSGGDAEVVENLKKFHCLMQEEVYVLQPDGTRASIGEGNKFQIVRDLNAVAGRFFYQRQILTANRVFVSRYDVPGWTLPEMMTSFEPNMKGIARFAELSFGSGYKFRADNLKATFFSPEIPK